LAENVAEFLLEERRVLVRPERVDEFAGDVTRLRDDVERATKRLAKLEQKLDQKLAERPAPAAATASTASTAVVPAPDNAVIEAPKTPDNTADS
jgi:ubiquinone biosynthesis protein UbiJ